MHDKAEEFFIELIEQIPGAIAPDYLTLNIIATLKKLQICLYRLFGFSTLLWLD